MPNLIGSNIAVQPAIVLSFRGDRLAGAPSDPADDQYRYVIANESVRAFSIRATIGKSGDADYRTFTLARRAQNNKRYFSDQLNAYLLPTTPGKDIDDLLKAHDSSRLALSMDFEVDYCLFSEYILRYVARESNDGGEYNSLAFPVSGEELRSLDNALVSVTHSQDFGPKHRFTTRYKLASNSGRTLTGVTAKLLGRKIDLANPSRPGVILCIDVSLLHMPNNDARRKAQRMFLASDHYKLIKYATWTNIDGWPYDVQYQATPGPPPPSPPFPQDELVFDITSEAKSETPTGWVSLGTVTQYLKEGKNTTAMQKSLRVWRKNLLTYFANYVDIKRGERIRQKLIADAKQLANKPGTTRETLVKAIRDAVDKYLITANHWNGSREIFRAHPRPRDIETHQHIMSDTFGEIHRSTYYGGSPVYYIREIASRSLLQLISGTNKAIAGSPLYWLKTCKRTWTDEEEVAYCLQIGAGHCGEHAAVCYSITKEAMASDAKVRSTLVNIVRSGNANVDHAFCVVGIHASKIWHDKRTKNWGQGESLRKKDERLSIWDLEDALVTEHQTQGFVMDAYLGDLQRATAEGLLQKIKGSPEHTHYLSFDDQYPYTGTDEWPTTSTPDLKPDI